MANQDLPRDGLQPRSPISVNGEVSSPTFLPDPGDTWGGPSVLLSAGWSGERISIPQQGLPAPSAVPERDAAARFEKLILLGTGGMGEVWRVRDVDLNRVVAMKIIRLDRGVNDQIFARFVAEAQATAQLEHPGIVPVYEIGRLPDNRIYYTMQEIRGRNLSAVLTDLHAVSAPSAFGAPESGWTFLKVMEAFRQVAVTVAFAHARGVIHRDLKPANIMLGAWGEVKVVDWGLVKVLERTASPADRSPPLSLSPMTLSSGDSSGTSAGAIAGTRGYMAPEQAAGEIDRLSPASDVYALGGILFALLSGRPPELPGSPGEVLASLPRVPVALREVVVRAMALDPAERYPEAGALAEAVSDWLEGAARLEQQRAQIDRLEGAFLALPAPVQLAARELLLSLYGADGQPRVREAADLDAATRDALRQAGLLREEGGRVALAEPEAMAQWDRLKGWLEVERPFLNLRAALRDQARRWEERGQRAGHLSRGEALLELQAWIRQRSPVLGPVEQRFVAASVAGERTVRRRKALGIGAIIALLGLGLTVSLYQERQTRAALDEARAARAAEQQALSVAEGRLLGAESALASSTGRDDRALALALAAADRLQGDPAADARVRALAARTDPMQTFPGHTAFLYHAEWAGPDRFVTSAADRTLRLWDRNNGLIRTFDLGDLAVTIGVSPDGERVAAVLESGGWELWDLARGERIAADKKHNGFGLWAEFSPDGRFAVTTAVDDAVHVWDARTGEHRFALPLGKVSMPQLSFSADGSRLLTVTERPTVWDLNTGAAIYTLEPSTMLSAAALSPDGARLSALSATGELHQIALDSGRVLAEETVPGASAGARLTYAAGGERLVVARRDGVLMVYAPETLAFVGGSGRPLGVLRELIPSPDGRTVLVETTDGTVGLADSRNGAWLASNRDPSGLSSVARLSPDGRAVLFASSDAMARLWTPPIFGSQAMDQCGGSRASPEVDSGDGMWFAMIQDDGGVCVRPLASDTPRGRLPAGAGRPLALDRAGARLALLDEAGAIVQVAVESGAPLWRVELEESVISAAYSRAEKTLLLYTEEGNFLLLSTEDGAERARFQSAEFRFSASALLQMTHAPLAVLLNRDAGINLVDLDGARSVATLPPSVVSTFAPGAIGVAEDGHTIAAGDSEGNVRLWLDPTGQPLWQTEVGLSRVEAVAISPDGSVVAAGDGSGQIALLDPRDGAVKRRLAVGGVVQGLRFTLDGQGLLATLTNGEDGLWDLKSGELRWQWRNPYGLNGGVCPLPNGQILAFNPGGMRIWDGEVADPQRRTNLRVCEGGTEVVPVPQPLAGSRVWAPEALCGEGEPLPQKQNI